MSAPTCAVSKEDEWSIISWAKSLDLQTPLANALKPTVCAAREADYDYLKKLAGKKDEVHRLLENAGLLGLESLVIEALNKLMGQVAQSVKQLQATHEANKKFEMTFASLDLFFGGLEDMIGSPDPRVLEAMEREHCCQDDSKVPFKTGNYGVRTTSLVEWSFVCLNGDNPPAEYFELSTGKKIPLEIPGDKSQKGWPIETCNCHHPRQPLATQLHDKLCDLNSQLGAINEPRIIKEELLGGRLYTGPMFEKYNSVLRGGALNCKQLQNMVDKFERLCMGNRYVTTIHAISSAVVKLGKLTQMQDGVVYRGLSDGALPKSFKQPNDFGVRGGAEYAFMSTSRDRAVATSYIAGSTVGIILELEMGMVDRGADLSSISQYPLEKEVLFGPLTSLQVLSMRVDGAMLVVRVRPNINLTNTTMDRVIAKRRVLLEGMCDNLRRECEGYLKAEDWNRALTGGTYASFQFLEKSAGPDAKNAGELAAHIDEKEADLIRVTIRKHIPSLFEPVFKDGSGNKYDDQMFTDDGFFKVRVDEALEMKKYYISSKGMCEALESAAQALESAGNTFVAERANAVAEAQAFFDEKNLDFGSKTLGDAEGTALAHTVEVMSAPRSQLQTLNVASCGLGLVSSQRLAAALPQLRALKELIARNNKAMGDVGCAAILRGAGAQMLVGGALERIALDGSGAGRQAEAVHARWEQEMKDRVHVTGLP